MDAKLRAPHSIRWTFQTFHDLPVPDDVLQSAYHTKTAA